MENMLAVPKHSHNKFWLAVLLLVIVAGLLSASLFSLNGDLQESRSQISQVEGQIASTLAELVEKQAELLTTQSDLALSRSDLTSVEAALSAKEGELAVAMADLTATQGQFATTQSTVADLQADYNRITSGYGYILKDPTYQSLVSFLARDKTSEKTYDVNNYNCVNFSADVKVNAAKEYIRSAYVAVDFPGSTGHSLLAFDTTDRGIIYIEPQSDEEVRLEVGKPFYECIIPRAGYYYKQPADDDTIERFVVVW
jgi:multidrug efflux pump subunit AcrA (membrane-fusion protein)